MRHAYHYMTRNCPVCGTEFKAARDSAVYDKPACRQKAKRDRDMLDERGRRIRQLLHEIARTEESDYKHYVLNWIQMTLDQVKG